jgi:hypothetical protein
MFAISIETTVGNGRNTLFWTDRWMHGCCLADLAPEVVQCVPVRLRNRRTVYEALNNNAWVADIRNALGLRGLTEYLELWDLISEVNLTDTDDLHRWKPEASGVFSTKSAYRCYFVGSITFEPWKRIWKAWAPGKFKTFLWLAIRNRCWTADRLQKRGMPHPLSIAFYVIKRMKQPSTFSRRVSLQNNSGMLFCSLSAWKAWHPLGGLTLLIGGRKLRRGSKNSTKRVLTPFASWELGHFGNIEMPVFLMDHDHPQTCNASFQG